MTRRAALHRSSQRASIDGEGKSFSAFRGWTDRLLRIKYIHGTNAGSWGGGGEIDGEMVRRGRAVLGSWGW